MSRACSLRAPMMMRSGRKKSSTALPLFQELGIRHHLQRHVTLGIEALLNAVARANRNCTLDDDDRGLGRMSSNRTRGGQYGTDVRPTIRARGGPHGDEVCVRSVERGREVRGKAKSTGAFTSANDVGESGLINRNHSLLEWAKALGIDVHAQHVVAEFGQSCAGDEPNITDAENDRPHGRRTIHAPMPKTTHGSAQGKRQNGGLVRYFSGVRGLISRVDGARPQSEVLRSNANAVVAIAQAPSDAGARVLLRPDDRQHSSACANATEQRTAAHGAFAPRCARTLALPQTSGDECGRRDMLAMVPWYSSHRSRRAHMRAR